jgi:hypothetical protein
MRAPPLPRLLLAACFALLPLSAAALPVTYNFTSGSVNVTATLFSPGPSTVLLNGSTSITVPLDGVSFTFDDTALSVSGFLFTSAGPISATLSPTVFGVSSISLTNLSMTPNGAITVGGGPTVFSLLLNAVDVNGSASTNAGPSAPFATLTTTGASGQITLGAGGTLQVTGITIGVINDPLGSGNFALLKGDFTFNGVPEPSAAVLLIVGAGAVTAARRSRR